MQQCGSTIRNVVANAKLDFFICPSLNDFFGINLFYLGKTHKSIFYRETSCGRVFEIPYREYLKSQKIDIFFFELGGRIGLRLSRDMVWIFRDLGRATRSTRMGLF